MFGNGNSSGLFGSGQASGTSSLFGGSNTQNGNPVGTTNAFGASGASSVSGGTGLFAAASKSAPTTGLFGAAIPTTTSIFGTGSSTQPTQPGAFGNVNTTTADPFRGTQSAQQPTASSLFGGNAPSATPQNVSLFGGSSQPSSSIFRPTVQPSLNASVFRTAPPASQPATTSVFGSTKNLPPQGSSNGLFGTSASSVPSLNTTGLGPTVLGSSPIQQTTSTGSLFGTAGQSGQNVPGSLSGTPQLGMLSAPLAQGTQPNAWLGSATAPSPAKTSLGMFGGASATQPSQGTESSLSGPVGTGKQSTPTATTSSIFGAASPGNSQPNNSLFGGASTTKPACSGEMTAAATSVGNTPTQSGGGGLFGTSVQPPAGTKDKPADPLIVTSVTAAAPVTNLFGSTSMGTANSPTASTNTTPVTDAGTSTGAALPTPTGKVGASSGLFGVGATGTSNLSSEARATSTEQKTSTLFGTTTTTTEPPKSSLFGVAKNGSTGDNTASGQPSLFGLSTNVAPSAAGMKTMTFTSAAQPFKFAETKVGESDMVNIGPRPSVRDIARLHPDVASVILELLKVTKRDETTIQQIKDAFDGVSETAAATAKNLDWRRDGVGLTTEKIEFAEQLLEQAVPSVTRLARLQECLQNDFSRLDSGLVAVPPLEHAELIEEFVEKSELLRRSIDSLKRTLESLEKQESIQAKLSALKKTTLQQDEQVERVRKTVSMMENRFKRW